MERTLTALQVDLYHPTVDPAAFTNVPWQWQHDTSPLVVGQGQDAHLQLLLPQLSRRHLSLEPYVEKGSTVLTFCVKVLSRKSCVWVDGRPLRYLEQVPLSIVSRISFCDVQMMVHVERGTSLEGFVCCLHLSPSPLICQAKAEENDEWEGVLQGPPQGSGMQTPGHLQLLHSPSQAQNTLQPSLGEGTEVQL